MSIFETTEHDDVAAAELRMIDFAPRVRLVRSNIGQPDTNRQLPTGTVTLLLADIEGSTKLWERSPEQMADALATLDRTLATLVADHHGVCPVQQGEGDSFVVAFVRASDAVACALALQQAALSPLRLRIGLHTGEIALRDEDNYMGPTINRAARLRDLGHGGQTLVSGTTAELVGDLLPQQAWLVELGRYALRDLPRVERVSQLCHPDLHNEFPALRGGSTKHAGWNPVHLTAFVGRKDELDRIDQLLENTRLLTLVGAGGIGKTRLAVEAAKWARPRYADGVCFVDLASVENPGGVIPAAARALALAGPPDRSVTLDVVTRHIGDRELLFIVDNCEHQLDASVELVEAVLNTCPNATVLATSREPLAAGGEQLWQVPPLSLDDAVALFTERARRARPEFAVDEHGQDRVRELCERLDGLPLAIELAASRVRALSLDEICAGLADRFRFLVGGARTVAHRQQTLKACVDWSYALLSEPERVALRQLSALPGTFDAAEAEVALGGGDTGGVQAIELLTALVDKSLLTAQTLDGRTRYRFTETMRQYAADRLEGTGELRASLRPVRWSTTPLL